MSLFILSLVPLIAGPLLVRLLQSAQLAARMLDGFVLVSVGGLVFLHILPHAIGQGGVLAVVATAVGLLLPLVSGKLWHGEKRTIARNLTLILALIALGLHATIDGLALASHDGHHHEHGSELALAVVLHRLPVGLGIWWLVRPRLGVRIAIATVALIVAATTAGYVTAHYTTELLTGVAGGSFQALVAGSLVHVVVGHRHGPAQAQPAQSERQAHRWRPGSAIGALLAVILLVLLSFGHEVEQTHPATLGTGLTFLTLALQSAPFLLLAYLLISLMEGLLPHQPEGWLKRSSAVTQTAVGAVVGLPLCVYSCSIAQLYRSLIRRGVPAPAAIALLVAAPELGVATILLSLRLLGVQLGLVRVGIAIGLALTVGLWIGRQVRHSSNQTPGAKQRTLDPEPRARLSNGSGSVGPRLARALRNGFGETAERTLPWFLVGLGLAAVVEPLLTPEQLALIPKGWDVVLMALVGLPLQVCSFGFTPVLAVLVYKGLSPGAALTLLLVGATTNLAILGMLSRQHGRPLAIRYGVALSLLAVGAGFVANQILVKSTPISLPDMVASEPDVFSIMCLALITTLTLGALFRQGAEGLVAQLRERAGRPGHHHCRDPELDGLPEHASLGNR